MSKWKCDICGTEFENFHAQGFDNKIYCPLCYFKKENQELKEKCKAVSKGLGKVALKRNKWKRRYEKERMKNRELKQELEVAKEVAEEHFKKEIDLKNQKQEWIDLRDKFKTQQKEFIEWLEAYIEDRDKVRKLHEVHSLSEERLSSQYFILQHVLSKYKEIIGGKHE